MQKVCRNHSGTCPGTNSVGGHPILDPFRLATSFHLSISLQGHSPKPWLSPDPVLVVLLRNFDLCLLPTAQFGEKPSSAVVPGSQISVKGTWQVVVKDPKSWGVEGSSGSEQVSTAGLTNLWEYADSQACGFTMSFGCSHQSHFQEMNGFAPTSFQ